MYGEQYGNMDTDVRIEKVKDRIGNISFYHLL